jgi:hypothetical protein
MLLFCLLLSSCTKQQSRQHKKSVTQLVDKTQNSLLDMIGQHEAMLVDVPIPLYDERIIIPLSDNSEGGTLVFGYKSPLSCEQAINFFITQMERLGWKHLVRFDGIESILQFESPDRYCTVVVKSNAASHSSIFIYLKKASL